MDSMVEPFGTLIVGIVCAVVCVGTDVLSGCWVFAAFFRRTLNEFIW